MVINRIIIPEKLFPIRNGRILLKEDTISLGLGRLEPETDIVTSKNICIRENISNRLT